MDIKKAATSVLDELKSVLKQIKYQDYIKVIPAYEASVGQHTRHVIEFYDCLFEGLERGRVNYDNRKRDTRIENEIEFALQKINDIVEKIEVVKEDPPIILAINYDLLNGQNNLINSTFYRELAYNIEHAIHHMAIIKTLLTEFFTYIQLPENFGIAVSTLRHRAKTLN